METVEVTLTLPKALVEEASAYDLLNAREMETILREVMDRRANVSNGQAHKTVALAPNPEADDTLHSPKNGTHNSSHPEPAAEEEDISLLRYWLNEASHRELTRDEKMLMFRAAISSRPIKGDFSNRREDWYDDDGR